MKSTTIVNVLMLMSAVLIMCTNRLQANSNKIEGILKVVPIPESICRKSKYGRDCGLDMDSIIFNSDGSKIVYVGKYLYVIDPETGKLEKKINMKGVKSDVLHVFNNPRHPDIVGISTYYLKVFVFNIKTGKIIFTSKKDFGHVTSFTSDGNYLLVGKYKPSKIKLIDYKNGKTKKQITLRFKKFYVNPTKDGKYYLMPLSGNISSRIDRKNKNPLLAVYDVENERTYTTSPQNTPFKKEYVEEVFLLNNSKQVAIIIGALRYDPQSRRLLTKCGFATDGEVRVYTLPSLKYVKTITPSKKIPCVQITSKRCFQESEKESILCSLSGEFYQWDIRNKKISYYDYYAEYRKSLRQKKTKSTNSTNSTNKSKKSTLLDVVSKYFISHPVRKQLLSLSANKSSLSPNDPPFAHHFIFIDPNILKRTLETLLKEY